MISAKTTTRIIACLRQGMWHWVSETVHIGGVWEGSYQCSSCGATKPKHHGSCEAVDLIDFLTICKTHLQTTGDDQP